MSLISLGFLFSVFGWSGYAYAEGSRSLYPTSYPAGGARADLDLEPNLAPYIGKVTSSTFLYVYAQAGEYIVLGSRNRSNGGDINVYNPQNFGVPGAEIYNHLTPGTPDFKCSTGPGAANYFGGTTGTITTRAQELAGPKSADGTTPATGNTYVPCAYQAPVTGSYGVLFFAANGANNPNGNIGTPAVDSIGVSAWDVTVRATNTSITDINGRLYTYAFIGFTGGNSRPVYSTLYYVTRDGYRYQQDLDGLDGAGYALYSNSLGFFDSGQPLYKDLRGNDSQVSTPVGGATVTTQTAENPTFFSDISPAGANATEVNRVLSALNIPLVPPSPTVTNVDFIGNVSGSTTYLGTGGTFKFDTSNTVTYQIVISLDGINFDPANTSNKTLTGLAPSGSHSVAWDGRNNSGSNFPAGGPYSFKVSGRAGEVHFPIIDAENNYYGGPTITRLNGTGAPDTTVFYDDRGYVLSSGFAIGTLNGLLCPTATPPQPVPAYSLAGIDSSISYRTWGVLTGTSNTNGDCTSTNAWGDAKAVNLWTYYSYTPAVQNLSIIAVPVDVEAVVTGVATATTGNTVQGTFAFANNGTGTAHGLTYSMSLSPGLGGTVTFGNLPTGATAAYNNTTGVVTLAGFPATLAAGAAVTGATAGAPMTYSYTAPATSVTVSVQITTTDTDGFPANNTDSIKTYIGAADVMTTVSVPSIAAPYALVAGNILFANNGANAAAGVTYSATIGNSGFYPALVTFTNVPAGVTPSYNSATGAVTFTGLPTTLGSSQSFNIGFSYYAPGSGSVPVSSSITTTSTDANPSNNNSSASTSIGPDLTITKSRGSYFYTGQTGATYTITVTNVGGATDGSQVSVTDTLPAGLTATAISGPGWACVLGTLTCTRSDVLAAGASYPAITLTVNVTAATGTVLVNNVSVSGGGDINTANNTGSDLATVTAATAVDLSITKTHTGNFTQGQTGATYTITVANVGTLTKATGNTVTVTDTLPVGLAATAIAGTGWTCTLATLTCTRSDVLNVGASYAAITVTVTVAATASSPLVNTASVSLAGTQTDAYTGNNTATDSTIVLTTLPDLTITKSHSSDFYLGATGVAYTITVSNIGSVSTSAGNTVSVTDTLPSGLTATAISGTGWTCTLGTLTCTRTDALAAGSSYPNITLTVNVLMSAPYTLTNTAVVSLTGQSESNYNNNTAQDTTTITPTVVTLIDFTAYNDNGQVVVQWETASEHNTLGFHIFRLDAATGQYRSLTQGLLPGLMTFPIGGTYTIIDSEAIPGEVYQYELVEVETNGKQITYGPFNVTVGEKTEANSLGSLRSSATASVAGSSSLPSGYSRNKHEQSALQESRLQTFKALRESTRLSAAAITPAGSRIKIAVSEDGMYYMDASDISSLLGIRSSSVSSMIAHNQLSVSNQGMPVSYLPAQNNTGIYFYGIGTDSVYTRDNIYWIDTGKGKVMNNEKGRKPSPTSDNATFTDTVHVEQDLIANMALNDPNADYWAWDLIFLSPSYSDGPKSFTFTVNGKADTSTAADLQVHLMGGSDSGITPDHHVIVSLNGQQIGEGRWGGLTSYTLTATFNQSLINEGENTIEVQGVLDPSIPWSMFFIDSFDLTYERLYVASGNSLFFTGDGNQTVTVGGFTTTTPDILLFNISDPWTPKVNASALIDGSSGNYEISFNPASRDARYLAVARDAAIRVSNAMGVNPSDLQARSNMADYLVIVPEALVSAVQPLADYRRSQGMRTLVVKLDDIMNDFNFGISSPEAIRQFLSYAYSNWIRAPKYVVLAGAGTWDYRDNLGKGGNLIPPALVPTPTGLTTSDNYLADVNGDHVPEMAIGRLPVLVPDDLTNIIKKIKTFESSRGSRAVLFADSPDNGGDFTADSEGIAALLPLNYVLEKVYLAEHSADDAKTMLSAYLNSGSVFFNYIGHGGIDVLSKSAIFASNEQYYPDALQVDSLVNGYGLPVMVAMTCTAGDFAVPGYPSLSESMLLKSGGGTAAVWSATGLSDDAQARILNKEFYKAIFSSGKKTLGDAVLQALIKYRTNGSLPYMMDMYSILGDPALRLK